jgi:hypothetical protein
MQVNGRLNGNQIHFTAGENQYTGRVAGNTMEGTMKPGSSWKATRASK